MAEYEHIKHTFEPVYNQASEILILGSFPSVKSREQGFYYGHPYNRFWKVLANIFECDVPETIEEKKQMLLSNHVAIWDVIAECDIIGSSDSSIKNVTPADINSLLAVSNIKYIYANGKTAEKLYRKYALPLTDRDVIVLPSTSPANAAYSLEKLTSVWRTSLNI